ncbi:MAG: hypothetical protein GX621_17570, partial [Pirellulaceae bacterium]|nr:hypothetical protein [Pirellulaceae bacterium]
MRVFQWGVLVMLGFAVALAAVPAPAAVYFQEDFNAWTQDNGNLYYGMWAEGNPKPYWSWYGEVNPTVDYNGWLGMWKRIEILAPGKTYPNELFTSWTSRATFAPSQTPRLPPGTIDGTASTGVWLKSDSKQNANGYNDTGESYDIWSPAFSTVGATDLWLHCAAIAVTNDNYGHSVFMVDATTDNGATWTTLWKRISPERSTPGATDPPAATYVP